MNRKEVSSQLLYLEQRLSLARQFIEDDDQLMLEHEALLFSIFSEVGMLVNHFNLNLMEHCQRLKKNKDNTSSLN